MQDQFSETENEPPPLRDLLPGLRVVRIREEPDWTVIEFETGHELHIPAGSMVIVHPGLRN